MVREKTIVLILLVAIFLLAGLVAFLFLKPTVIEIRPNPSSFPEEKPITLVFVGDIMLDRGVELKINKEGQEDFKFPFLKIVDDLKKADLVFGNLESQISDKGRNVGSIYSFRAKPEAIDGLVFAGFDIVSLANNHAFDYTAEALADSISRLVEAKISPIGAGYENQAFAPTIKTINPIRKDWNSKVEQTPSLHTEEQNDFSNGARGTKIALFAYTDQAPKTWQAENQNIGIAIVSKENLDKVKIDIALAKQLADVVIVSWHSGTEYSQEISESQTFFAKEFIKVGADLVIGHHPHLVQKSEIYQGKYIFYSLGNFVFDQDFSEETMAGQILEVLIKNNKIKEVKAKDIKINESFQPEIVDDNIKY